MKRKEAVTRVLLLGGCLILLMALYSCGDGENGIGTPGYVSGDSGSVILVNSIIGATEVGDSDETLNVDGLMNICPDGDYEEFTDHLVEITFTNMDRPNATEPTASDVIIEYYTIDYRRANSDSNPAPTLPSRTIYHTFTLPANSEVIVDFIVLVDIETKTVWANYYTTAYYSDGGGNDNEDQLPSIDDPTRYVAVYTFYGQTIFGDYISFTASVSFTIGNFDNC